jgi:N-acetylneuraminic acid mutarotase
VAGGPILLLCALWGTAFAGQPGALDDASQVSPAWAPVASMNLSRALHSSTLLPNGKLLVAGGYSTNSNGQAVSSAELFDPSNGTWTLTGSMTAARLYHTATVLTNGKVLVVGGNTSTNLSGAGLASAELYDPNAGTWTATGSLHVARFNHTATLLPNGKVLVVGGFTSAVGYLSSAELYDPTTGTWSITGSLHNGRLWHTATLLPNGTVLVVGGQSSLENPLTSAEIYDPTTGTWSVTGNLNLGRYYHSATLLATGKVLVAGGSTQSALYPGTGSQTNAAELYDPSTGTWAATGSLNTGRFGHTASLLPNGKVVVVGGSSASALASAELYDPNTATWSTLSQLNTARVYHLATVLTNGKIIVTGGLASPTPLSPVPGQALSVVESYDLFAGAWSSTGALSTARVGHTATLLPNGLVLVAGGYTAGSGATYLASAELYDSTQNVWRATGSLNQARAGHTATLLANGKVLVAGGVGPAGPVGSTEIYDPATGTWSLAGNLNVARDDHAATLLANGDVLIAGGLAQSSALNSAEIYDPVGKVWTLVGNLAAPRENLTLTLLPTGQALAVGGQSAGVPVGTAELFDPASGNWTPTGTLNTPRSSHTATLLPNGKVLVAGGQGSTSALSSAELYDPTSGIWSLTGSLIMARTAPSAVLLPSRRVLVTGGSSGVPVGLSELYDPMSGAWSSAGTNATPRALATSTLLPSGGVLLSGGQTATGAATSATELWNSSLNYQASWQPSIVNVSPIVPSGTSLSLSGSQFEGISEAAGGNTNQSSPTNFPLVLLRSLANEQSVFLSPGPGANWSSTVYTSSVVSGLPNGYALATVWANGIPSGSSFVLVGPTGTTAWMASASVAYGSADASLSATVGAPSPVGQGNVTFALSDGSGNPVGTPQTVSVTAGAATASFALPVPLPTGAYTVTASYDDGGVQFANSSAAASFSVVPAATSLGAAAAAATFGDASATVTGVITATTGIPVNEGTVALSLTDDNGNLVAGPVNASPSNGFVTGQLSLAGLPAGSYAISLAFAGSNDFQASTAPNAGALTVLPAGVTVGVGNATATYGDPSVPVTATLVSQPGLSVSEGTVTFSLIDPSGATVAQSEAIAVSSEQASTSFSLAGLSAGSYGVVASFSGGPDFEASPPVTGTLTIAPAATTASAASAGAVYDQPAVILQATLGAANGLVVREGTATFSILDQSGSVVGQPQTAPVQAGAATVSYTLPPGLPLGAYTISLAYADDVGNFRSSGNQNQLTIGAANTASSVLAAAATYGQASVTVTAQVAAVAPAAGTISEGSVSFAAVDAGGAAWATANAPVVAGVANATLTLPAGMPASAYILTAAFAGSNFQPSSASNQLALAPAATSVSASGANSTFGDPFSVFTATVTSPSGLVVSEGVVTFTVSSGPTVLGRALSPAVVNGVASAHFSLQGVNAGSYTVSASYGSAANFSGSVTAAPASLVVAPATTFLGLSSPASTYGVPITLTAQLSPAGLGGQAATGAVEFSLSGASLGSAPLDSSGRATLANLANGRAPGSYPLSANFVSSDSNFVDSAVTGTLVVGPEPALATYTGAVNATTISPTLNTAKVTLSATIADVGSGSSGDVRSATVTFVDPGNNNAPLCSGPVGLASVTTSLVGTTTCTWVASLGNATVLTRTVGLQVGGYYLSTSSASNTVVTVTLPSTSDSVAGAGTLHLTTSAGRLSGDNGSSAGFNLEVSPNPTANNLGGSFKLSFTAGGRAYQVVSDSFNSLSVQPANGTQFATAAFDGAALLRDVTNPNQVVVIDPGAAIQVTLLDGGLGVNDQISVSVWSRRGGLWFANAWNGAAAIPQNPSSGNIAIH